MWPIDCGVSLRSPREADGRRGQHVFRYRERQGNMTHSHRDSHFTFSYRVHRRTDEGGIEGNVAGDLAHNGDIASCKVDPSREEQKVVVGETTVNF